MIPTIYGCVFLKQFVVAEKCSSWWVFFATHLKNMRKLVKLDHETPGFRGEKFCKNI